MIVQDIRRIIDESRANAVRSVDFCRVQMYWHIGQRIVEEEQCGEARAEYGKYIIRNLSKELMPEYGSGFGVRQLEQAGNSITNIQLRTHCVRNSTGLNIVPLFRYPTRINVNIMNLRQSTIIGRHESWSVRYSHSSTSASC
jgi:hypothetical protein